MRTKIEAFVAGESGATAIEYGLISAMIAVSCITAFTLFGGSLSDIFNMLRDRAGGAMDNAGLPETPTLAPGG